MVFELTDLRFVHAGACSQLSLRETAAYPVQPDTPSMRLVMRTVVRRIRVSQRVTRFLVGLTYLRSTIRASAQSSPKCRNADPEGELDFSVPIAVVRICSAGRLFDTRYRCGRVGSNPLDVNLLSLQICK